MAEVKVSEIPDEGLSLSVKEDPAALDLAATGVRFLEPVAVDVFLVKADKAVMATGRIAVPVAFECVRCLREFPASLDIPISTQFVPPPELPLGEHPMPPDEAEDYYYRDDGIVLDDLVRQEVLLAVPFNPQCRDDCRGLCAQCGQDLNRGACACAPPPDPRWTVLRQHLKGK
ncbi:MAG: DUF177 domain-containing protein [Nitrospirae bacterium]|nr:MAG: DUF177 domain-containing protein [Nitrospirota bacterium]